MKQVNVHEAKTQLSRLLKDVENGEEVYIARAGKPVAKLVRAGKMPKRKGGQWRGLFKIPAGFDEPDPEIVASFEDSVLFPGDR